MENSINTVKFVNDYLTTIAKNIFGDIVKSASINVDINDYDEEELQEKLRLCLAENNNDYIGNDTESDSVNVSIEFNNGRIIRTSGFILKFNQ